MLRHIHIELPLPLIDDVLVERRALRDGIDATRLIDLARKRARRIVESADNEAAAIRRHACATGFREGFGDALHALSLWFRQYDASCTEVVFEMRAELRDRLHVALLEPLVVEHVIQSVFGSTSIWNAQRVRVRLPDVIADCGPRLTQLVEAAGGAVLEIMPSQDSRLTIECGDQVFTFDAGELAASLSSTSRTGFPRTAEFNDIDFATLAVQARNRST